METEHLREALKNLNEEYEARTQDSRRAEIRASHAIRDLREAQERLEDMHQAIQVIESLLDGTASRPETTHDFVVSALRSTEGPLRDTDILQAILKEDWRTESTDPLTVLRTILSRMIKEDQLERVSPRTYQLPQQTTMSLDDENSRPATDALLASDGEGG